MSDYGWLTTLCYICVTRATLLEWRKNGRSSGERPSYRALNSL
jgi:hypothetical protein